jgi:ABC-type molybdenum transport system ATPase subunit/photorepair protein PhrA
MIVFKKIKWKNFLSTGINLLRLILQKNQTNLIVGTNGAGKSLYWMLLHFSLFNKPFRKINKPQLINTTNEKDCLLN